MVEREIPVIDVERDDAPHAIDAACRRDGFFVIVGHGIDESVFDDLEVASREFFARPDGDKDRIAMRHAGPAWRGWFPPGGELTSGVPDGKEGIYFGREDGAGHPRVRAATPLHGANLFPADSDLGPLVLRVLDELTELGHRLCRLVAVGLGLEQTWFADHLTTDPTILFRIFHYPARPAASASRSDLDPVADADWGVQEHTDYGLLTILRQDDVGGLEVRRGDSWVEAPPVAGSFVCNIGDMLERMTGGTYRSTAHRVRRPPRNRLSFPFFFDPSWDAEIVAVPGLGDTDAPAPARWDGRSVFDFDGTYGEYLSAKVARVFPQLWEGQRPRRRAQTSAPASRNRPGTTPADSTSA